MRLAIAASGALGFKCIQSLPGDVTLTCVFTDSNSGDILKWCSEKNIPFFKSNPRNGRASSFIQAYTIDVLFSVNYIFLFDKQIIEWPLKYAFNIHGSLLPKYRGRTPHVWAIINGESKTGFTVHLVDEGCDTGDIVLQKEIEIGEKTTGGEILDVFFDMYPKAIVEVLKKVMENSVQPIPQDQEQATYFGKRTPADGVIDWNWKTQRIYNWVRAQAKPYPGAFGFCNDQKIIIHKVEICKESTGAESKNGLIVNVVNGKPIVKVDDGLLRLEEFEGNEIKKGDCFDTGY